MYKVKVRRWTQNAEISFKDVKKVKEAVKKNISLYGTRGQNIDLRRLESMLSYLIKSYFPDVISYTITTPSKQPQTVHF